MTLPLPPWSPGHDPRYAPAVLTARVQGDKIRLAVDGDWQADEIARLLQPGHCNLTAVPKKTNDGTGELSLPLTWAMVTQLSKLAQEHQFGWRPDPGLNEWITAEFERRFAVYPGPDGLKYQFSHPERVPMTHQLSGAYVGALNRRFFFGDAAGIGKTMTALLTIAELDAQGLDPWPVFVVAPASVVDPWLEELEECFPDWTFAAYRGPRRRFLSLRYQVYVMSWDVFRRDMFPQDLGECERCGDRVEWTKKLARAYDLWANIAGSAQGTREEKAKARELVVHHGCPEVLPSKGYAAYRPIETDKKVLPPLLDFLVPRTLVLDEAHALCNPTKQATAAVRIARVAEFVFPMSGTPITNDIGGFHTALKVLDVRSFPDRERYQAKYCDRQVRQAGRPEVTGLSTANRDEFYIVTQGSMRYVAKADVLGELPPKTYSTRVVTLPEAYRAAYDEMEEDMIAHIPDTDEPLPVMNTLAQMQRLAQLASAACDVETEMILDERENSPTRGEMIPHYKVTMREPSWKVDELMQLLGESAGEPVIAFAPYTQLIDLAGRRAEREGLRVGYIKGGQSARARTLTRRAFQAGELDLLCANTSAGGVGLTLTRSHTVAFLQRPWAYWRGDQSEDRAHRRGQTEPVSIIDIVAANTIESRVREVCKGKARQLSELVRDPRIVREFLGGQKIHV